MPFSIHCCELDLMLSDICINKLPCTRSAVMRIVSLTDFHTSTLHMTDRLKSLHKFTFKELYFSSVMFQVSAVLCKLISGIFKALLETGRYTLRADGDGMRLWMTCLSSFHLLLLSTLPLKCITFNVRRPALICTLHSSVSDIRVQLGVNLSNHALNVKIYSSTGHCAAVMVHRKQVRSGYIGQ